MTPPVLAFLPDSWTDPLSHIPGLDPDPYDPDNPNEYHDPRAWDGDDLVDPNDPSQVTPRGRKDYLRPRLFTEIDLKAMADPVTEKELTRMRKPGKWVDPGPAWHDDQSLNSDPKDKQFTAKDAENAVKEFERWGSKTWTTLPLTIRERYKQWGPIRNYSEYLKFMAKIGATAALSEERFEYEKKHLLKKLLSHWEEQEDLACLLDEPFVSFAPNHADKKAIQFKDFDRDGALLETPSSYHRWPTLDTLRSGQMEDGQEAVSSGDELDCFVLRTWRTINMKRGGRKRSLNALAVVGNRQGFAGFAIGKADSNMAATEKAISRAAKHLIHIPRRDERTIHHDTYAKCVSTKVYMQYAPDGHGIVAHSAIKEICQLAGIRDLIANTKGSLNPLNVVRGAFTCLQNQSDQIERFKRLGTVVEYTARDALPIVKSQTPVEQLELRRLETGLRERLPLSRREIKRLTFYWLVDFPLRPSDAAFELARIVRHGILLEQCLMLAGEPIPEGLETANAAAAAQVPELIAWFAAMPLEADPSSTQLYPNMVGAILPTQSVSASPPAVSCLRLCEAAILSWRPRLPCLI